MGGMWGRVNRCRLRFACVCARGGVALAGGWLAVDGCPGAGFFLRLNIYLSI